MSFSRANLPRNSIQWSFYAKLFSAFAAINCIYIVTMGLFQPVLEKKYHLYKL